MKPLAASRISRDLFSMMRLNFYRAARYCWYQFRLRNLYFLLYDKYSSFLALPIYHIYGFYKNSFFWRVIAHRTRKETDPFSQYGDTATVLSRFPGFAAVDYDRIESIAGSSVRYYGAGAFQTRDWISRSKIAMPLGNSWFALPHSPNPEAPAFEHVTNHFKWCLGIPRVVGESVALQLFQLFECFLILRQLRRQNREVECLLLDSGRDKLSELYTTCLPGCHFPEDRRGIHLFDQFIRVPHAAGGGGWEWRKNFYAPGLAGEFHRFVLSAFGVTPPEPIKRVKRITLIRRKQYTESSGKPCIDRVIKNEEEVIAALEGRYRGFTVQAVYLEELSIFDQLNQFSQTDILVGMHGAGVIVGAYFVPPNSGILELFPKYFRSPQSALTCRVLAASRELHYRRWLNHRRGDEFGTDVKTIWRRRYHRNPVRYASLTRVPVAALTGGVDRLIRRIERGR